MRRLVIAGVTLGACGHAKPAPIIATTTCEQANHAAVEKCTPSGARPRTDVDRDQDYDSAWTTWSAGHHDAATMAFRKLAVEALCLSTKCNPVRQATGVVGAPISVTANGTRAVALSGGGAYWFDAAGTPLRYESGVEASTVALFSYWDARNSDIKLTIIDAKGVIRARNVTEYATSASGKTLVYQDPSNALHVWDVPMKRERRVLMLGNDESCSMASIVFSPDEQELACSLFNKVAMFDKAGARRDFPGAYDAAIPSYSSDGKWIAYAYRDYDKDPERGGRTILIDRATRTIRTSSEVDYPTATRFSNSSKLLIVGGLREASILEVPSLRVLGSTLELRSYYEGIEDQQNITEIEIVGNDRAFWAQTLDDAQGVFRLPSGELIWRGRGDRTIDASGTLRIYDRDIHTNAPTGRLVTIETNLRVTNRALTQAEIGSRDSPDPTMPKMRALLETTVCTIGDRIYPIAACR